MRMPARLAAATSAVLLTLALGACSGGASDSDTDVRPIADLQDVDGTSEDKAPEDAAAGPVLLPRRVRERPSAVPTTRARGRCGTAGSPA